jgi:alcohol dehydrogenase, propanol-preferring
MKAMLLSKVAPIETSPLKYTDLPDPTPGKGEVRIRVSCCAICRTDLHVIEGDIHAPKMPIIPGHQIVGIIDRLGPECRMLKLGARIGAAWLRHTDGVCRFCTTGRENLCPNSEYTGFNADGGYAEYAIVPEAFAYELRSSMDDISVSPLLCAGIIGYRALKRCDLRPASKLGIFGFGSSAHIILQIAIARGHTVYVVSRNKNHQHLASSLGATWADSDAAALRTPLDGAIVFAPAGTVVPTALDSLDRGAAVALAGIHMSPIPELDYDKHLYGERDIHPVMSNTRQDGRELLAESEKASVRPHTKTYRLEEANLALQEMKSGKLDGTGVLQIGAR